MVGMTTRDAAVSWCLFWSRTACGFCHYTTILQLYSSPKVVLGVQYSYRYNLPGRCALASVLAGGGVGSVPSSCFALVLLDRGPNSLCVLPRSRPEIPDGAPAPHPEAECLQSM